MYPKMFINVNHSKFSAADQLKKKKQPEITVCLSDRGGAADIKKSLFSNQVIRRAGTISLYKWRVRIPATPLRIESIIISLLLE